MSGGEGGIRTHGTAKQYAGFRVRCIRPLCHLSVSGLKRRRDYSDLSRSSGQGSNLCLRASKSGASLSRHFSRLDGLQGQSPARTQLFTAIRPLCFVSCSRACAGEEVWATAHPSGSNLCERRSLGAVFAGAISKVTTAWMRWPCIWTRAPCVNVNYCSKRRKCDVCNTFPDKG
jgi:hypothetical protein